MLLLLHAAELTPSWKGCERIGHGEISHVFPYLCGMIEDNDSNFRVSIFAILELQASLICTGVSPSQPECQVRSLE